MPKVYPAPPRDVEIITEDNEHLESAWHRNVGVDKVIELHRQTVIRV
ncbi:MAG: hypothetical protein ABDI19_07010 [Armatimonadota bacterium]